MKTNPFPYAAVLRSCGGVFIALACLAFIPSAQATTYTLGTTQLLEGPAPGSDSVVLAVRPDADTWTATVNANWLHLEGTNQSGTGSAIVAFSFDANPAATRIGTLTIANQTITITQAGTNYVAAGVIALSVTNLSYSRRVATAASGNVYFAEPLNGAVKRWSLTDNSVTTLVNSGLNYPIGIAVDDAGNVFIADTDNNMIKMWSAIDHTVTAVVETGLNRPCDVTVDALGNLYIADSGNNAIKLWSASDQTVRTLVSSGLNYPCGVALDGTGNVYIADTRNRALKQWSPASNVLTTLNSSGFSDLYNIAVDGAGNAYVADNAVRKWSPSTGIVTTLVDSSAVGAEGVAVDALGNLFIDDQRNQAIKELPYAFVDPTAKLEIASTGHDTLPAVISLGPIQSGPLAPRSDQSWLTITGITNGIISFGFSANGCADRTAHISLLGQSVAITQSAATYSLGTGALWEGPMAGTDSVVLAVHPLTQAWSASANCSWLHLSAANQSGKGPTNVVFSYDANPGNTRASTITIGDQTLTITQAGSNFIAAPIRVTTLISKGLDIPNGIAVDASGDVFVGNSKAMLEKWMPISNTITNLAANEGYGLAADAGGDIYIAQGQTIQKWSAANNLVSTPVSGLSNAVAVAVDSAGNLYIADSGDNSIKKWTAASNTITTLIVSNSNNTSSLAVDAAGNVYIANTYSNVIKKWSAANNTVTTLINGLSSPAGIAVDGAGNVFIADTRTIRKWSAANNALTTLASFSTSTLGGLAVDALGNVFFTDHTSNAVRQLTRAFIDPAQILETTAAGSDALAIVLPPTVNLHPPFSPASDQSWLTITGVTNGVIGFNFAATQSNRTARLSVLGQLISISQRNCFLAATACSEKAGAGTDSVSLMANAETALWTAKANVPWLHLDKTSQAGCGSANIIFTYDANAGALRTGTLTIADQTFTVTQAGSILWEGPSAGSDSLIVAVNPATLAWTAVANVPWLHLSAGNQSGTGCTNLVFSYDANPGATRAGSLSIAGQEFFITQAGAAYVAAPAPTSTLISGAFSVHCLAVDNAGNLYYSDQDFSQTTTAIEKWCAVDHSITTLVSGLNTVEGLAVDSAGNVYFPDMNDNAIKKWSAKDNAVRTLFSAGLSSSHRIALDSAGNVYVTGSDRGALVRWSPTDNTITNLLASGTYPAALTVDAAGNAYFTEAAHAALKKWSAKDGAVTTLVSSGLNAPQNLAVDVSGNIYIIDPGYISVRKWTAMNNTLSTLTGRTIDPIGLAVDGMGNVYCSELLFYDIQELPRVFLDPSAKMEPPFAGSDTLAPMLPLPATWASPFAPTSDQPWLTVNGITNGVVSFNFTSSSGVDRIAHLQLFGQTISVTQSAPPRITGAAMLSNGLFQFAFSNSCPGPTFTVLTSTNLSSPQSNWSVVGTPTNLAPGLFQFTTTANTNDPQRFFRISSP